MKYKYKCRIEGDGMHCDFPYLTVTVSNGDISIPVEGLIDSGCQLTHIRSDLAEALGIDLSSVPETTSIGATGSSTCKLSKVTISIKDHGEPFESPAIFSDKLPIPLLLGQDNFFEKFDVKFEKRNNRFEIRRVL